MTKDSFPRGSHELDAALAAHPDGSALRQVWHALPRAADLASGHLDSAEPSTDERGAAWSRLRATIGDPSRVPFASDVAAPLTLGTDDADDALDRADSAAGVVPTTPARRRLTVPTVSTVSTVSTVAATRQTVWRWRAAAAVVGLVLAGGGGLRTVPVVYDAAGGAAAGAAVAVRAVRLADGSEVWLAPGSQITVPRALGWPGWLRTSSRTVQLRGRGFFSVQRDGRTFTVHTTDATIRVLGTRFDVRGPSGASGSQVTVEEGRVSVAAAATPGGRTGVAVELGAGQRILLGRGALSASALRTVPTERLASWRTGGLAALDEPLEAVLDELASRYAVEITRSANVDVAVTVSLFYPSAPTVDTVLGDLCTAQGLTFQRTSRGYHVARSDVRP